MCSRPRGRPARLENQRRPGCSLRCRRFVTQIASLFRVAQFLIKQFTELEKASVPETSFLAGKCLFFVVVDSKNFQQARDLQDFARGGAQPEQDEARTDVA